MNISLQKLKEQSMPKYIESIETTKVQLEVIECDCGFHLGLDATYLDQVDEIIITCPSCKAELSSAIILNTEEAS
jgi:hypothetical protein